MVIIINLKDIVKLHLKKIGHYSDTKGKQSLSACTGEVMAHMKLDMMIQRMKSQVLVHGVLEKEYTHY